MPRANPLRPWMDRRVLLRPLESLTGPLTHFRSLTHSSLRTHGHLQVDTPWTRLSPCHAPQVPGPNCPKVRPGRVKVRGCTSECGYCTNWVGPTALPVASKSLTHSLRSSLSHSLARPFAHNAHAMPSPLAALSLALAPFCSRSWSSAILAVADHSIAALCNKHLTHFDGQCRNTPSPAACHPPNNMRKKPNKLTDSNTPSTHSRCFSETVENQSQT